MLINFFLILKNVLNDGQFLLYKIDILTSFKSLFFFLKFYVLCIVNNRKGRISLETIRRNNLVSRYQDTTVDS